MSNTKDGKGRGVEDIVILTPKVMSVEELKGAEDNPREWPGPRMGRLKASILRFGLVEPLVWNETTGRLVGGHMRLAALKALGVKEVPVAIVRLTAQQEMALRLTLNNRAAQGRWSELVKKQVAETQLALPDFYKDLAVGEILDQLGGDAAADDKEKVEFEKSKRKKGKLSIKATQKVVELVERKLDDIATLNEFDGDGARGRAIELVFSDLEPKKYARGKQEMGE